MSGVSHLAGCHVFVTGSVSLVCLGACALGERCVNTKRVFFASLFTPGRERRKERRDAKPPLTGGRGSAARQARASDHAGATRAGSTREEGMGNVARADSETGAKQPSAAGASTRAGSGEEAKVLECCGLKRQDTCSARPRTIMQGEQLQWTAVFWCDSRRGRPSRGNGNQPERLR